MNLNPYWASVFLFAGLFFIVSSVVSTAEKESKIRKYKEEQFILYKEECEKAGGVAMRGKFNSMFTCPKNIALAPRVIYNEEALENE